VVLQASYPLTAGIVLVSVVAAVIPTLFYAGLIYWVDRYEKEPLWLLSAAFLWGAVPSIIFAFVINTVASVGPYLLLDSASAELVAASFIAPPVEETLKGLALLAILVFARHEIDSPLDGIIYGAMVGMGFAMVENVYYFVNVYSQGGTEAWTVNIFLRAVVFGLNHALFTSVTGLGLAVGHLARRRLVRYGAPVAGWLAAIFLHFVHNLSASLGGLLCLVALLSDYIGIFLIFLIIVWALVQEGQWIKEQLADEVGQGTLTARQYAIAGSSLSRLAFRFDRLSNQGYRGFRNSDRFYHKASELAYRKRHFARHQDPRDEKAAARLRAEVSGLSRLLEGE
jgi:protease PrsW